MDETWIHHYTPESKQQSKQWTEAGCSALKRQGPFHQQESSWHWCFGMLKAFFIDYLEKGKTITGECYLDLLTRLDEKTS